MMKTILVSICLLSLCINGSCSQQTDRAEIPADKAIQVARASAVAEKYDSKETAIEVIKFKEGTEKGPIRTDWLLHTFPREDVSGLLKNDFWVVYMYPRSRSILGGDFTVLVDLHTSKVLACRKGM